MISDKLPKEFVSSLKLNKKDLKSFLLAIDQTSPTSIRLNSKKPTSQFNSEELIPWSNNARFLSERISFTLDPLFHAGCYYVQEASSMLLEEAFKQLFPDTPTLSMLDLCAAPGGKSTHLLNLASKKSCLVSNELISSRNATLQYNLSKWGYANCIVTQNKPSDFTKHENLFDLIIVDAPCSGEGMFRKDPNSINEWSMENVEICSSRQTNILDSILPCLKENGIIIYSTCTYEESENDGQIEKLFEKYDLESVNIINHHQAVRTKFGIQCFPHLSKGEGFYMSVIRKISGNENEKPKNNRNTSAKLPAEVYQFMNDASQFSHLKVGERSLGIPHELEKLFLTLSNSLYIRKAGITLGIKKGKDFIPDHELALSIDRNLQISSIDVDKETALRFLKSETISLANIEHGWHLISFENQSLGWIKSVQGRINNYFPKNQRILMDLKK